jgi:SAM-dependent methyltransferase
MENVLVVGAGTGNDVAAALRAGAAKVTAVEIDPMILRLGDELHPEQPYANPAVSKVTEDARSFFSRTTDNYDLIVFGLLDSHALFSTASSARLDNFVYTHESILHVRDLLTEDGLLALSFGVPPQNEWMGLRLYRTITDAFGHSPQVFEFPNSHILFLIGLNPDVMYGIEDPRVQVRPDYSYRTDIPITTDDWPYLYLRDQAVPSTYLVTLIGIAALSFLLIRRSISNFTQFKVGFFFLGAGFFLLQTKSMTEMALLFGSTWVVNATVISAILIMIVFANWSVIRFELRETRVFYVLLFLSLIISYFVPIRTFLGLPDTLRTIVVSLEQAIPLFFASIIFAIRFQGVTSIAVALGSNLFGGVLGGLTEYASLALGIRSLYLFALVFYALSAIPQIRLVRKDKPISPS